MSVNFCVGSGTGTLEILFFDFGSVLFSLVEEKEGGGRGGKGGGKWGAWGGQVVNDIFCIPAFFFSPPHHPSHHTPSAFLSTTTYQSPPPYLPAHRAPSSPPLQTHDPQKPLRPKSIQAHPSIPSYKKDQNMFLIFAQDSAMPPL